jgi:diguanylate cyclase (GGDEF)-like protein
LDDSLIPLLIVGGVTLVAATAVLLYSARRREDGGAGLSTATMSMGNGAAAASVMPGGPEMRPVGGAVEATAEEPVTREPDDDEEGPAMDADGLIDPLTGVGTSMAWDFALRHEEARFARYKEPATVVIAELEGYEMLAERLGRDAADRLITPIANTLLRNSRRADRVARVGPVRFHVLLPKTDEITAINYVDRVREETDDWLAAGAVASRLVIGWASPGTGTTFADAMRVAEERMNADRRTRHPS